MCCRPRELMSLGCFDTSRTCRQRSASSYRPAVSFIASTATTTASEPARVSSRHVSAICTTSVAYVASIDYTANIPRSADFIRATIILRAAAVFHRRSQRHHHSQRSPQCTTGVCSVALKIRTCFGAKWRNDGKHPQSATSGISPNLCRQDRRNG
jgi:hypothetical protein